MSTLASGPMERKKDREHTFSSRLVRSMLASLRTGTSSAASGSTPTAPTSRATSDLISQRGPATGTLRTETRFKASIRRRSGLTPMVTKSSFPGKRLATFQTEFESTCLSDAGIFK